MRNFIPRDAHICKDCHDSESRDRRQSRDAVDDSQPEAQRGPIACVGEICRVVVHSYCVTKQAYQKIYKQRQEQQQQLYLRL